MSSLPSRDDLKTTLAAAGAAHHDYETRFLQGKRDEQWAGWYAAFVVGRLGDFVSPSRLTEWLQAAPLDGDWADNAAEFVRRKMEAA